MVHRALVICRGLSTPSRAISISLIRRKAQKEVQATFLQVALTDDIRLEYHLHLYERKAMKNLPQGFLAIPEAQIGSGGAEYAQQKTVFGSLKRENGNPK